MQSPVVTIEPEIQQIINKLTSYYRSAEFDGQFNNLAGALPTTKKFLIKQELARLFKPCIKAIDLSGNSQYQATEFKWKDKRFYFDEIAKRIFIRAVDKFGGEYTEGVYDIVTSPKIYKEYEKQFQHEEKLDAFTVALTELGKTTKRLEERLYCAKPVIIKTKSDIQLDAMTSNISRSGCLLRVKQVSQIKNSDILTIDFSALTEQFKFTNTPSCEYEVKFVSKEKDKDDYYRVGVQLHEDNLEWMQFLDKYVLANRASFKVDITNAKELTESRILENHLLKTTQWLPIFINASSVQVKQVKYCLTNPNNAQTFNFFCDHNKNNRLNSILFKIWPSLTYTKDQDNFILVAKLKTNDRVQFIAANLYELIEKKLLNLYINYAQLKGELKLFQIRTKAITPSLINQLKVNWFKTSAEANTALEPLTLTNQLICLCPLQHAQQVLDKIRTEKINKENLANLNQYLCAKIKNQSLAQFDVEAKCARTEHRFYLNSTVDFIHQKRIYRAQLQDLSAKGLSIRLPALPEDLLLDELISLSVSKLERFNQILEQTQARYKVVGINEHNCTIHLQLTEQHPEQPLLKYMQALIKQHRSKLKINDQYDKFVILQKALCIAFVSEYPGCAFGVSKSNKSLLEISRLLAAERKNNELDLLNHLKESVNSSQITLYPIFKGNEQDPYLKSLIDFIRSKQFSHDELIFVLNKHLQLEKRISLSSIKPNQLIDELKDNIHLKNILSTQLSFHPVTETGIEKVTDNLRYIARYNRHQAEQLKLFAEKLNGMIEMVNDTAFWQLISANKIDF